MVDSRSASEIVADKVKQNTSDTILAEQQQENKATTTTGRTSNRQTPMEAAGKTLIRTLAAGAGRVILTAISAFLIGKKKR